MSEWMHGRRLVACALGFALCLALGMLLPREHASGRSHGRATRGIDCGVCHTPEGWKVRDVLQGEAAFDHDRTGFPLRGGHARTACTGCHTGEGELSRACSSCHVDAHGGKLGTQCDRCHVASTFRRTDALALHSQTRLPLTGMHALVECADCHRRSSSDGFRSTPSQCIACHEADYRRPDVHPVHDGSGGAPPFPRNCAECHRTDAFSPAAVPRGRFLGGGVQALQQIDPRAHDRKFVISRGPHRGAPCGSCHVAVERPQWTRCGSCHTPSTLAAQHPRLGTPADGSCVACHAGGLAR